jgi:N-acetylmuramic acid 6-phosphate (MurNAc-6-P) etherase
LPEAPLESEDDAAVQVADQRPARDSRADEEENLLVKPKSVAYHSAEEFLKEADLYRLGDLPTEARHPETKDLSRLVFEDLPRAYRILQSIDRHAIEILFHHQQALADLQQAIQETLRTGNRVVLCGCGATGRLSLVLESIWKARANRQPAGQTSDKRIDPDAVTGFMAGGDIALVRSVENFEDIPEFGARQLHELDFRDGDLLVSTTEGGETPFVIGATEEAARISKRKPWFLYCNPDAALSSVERSKRVIDNPSIEKLSLPTGPMSLSGSTRLQASTVLMLAVGAGLFGGSTPMAELFEEMTAIPEPSRPVRFLAAFAARSRRGRRLPARSLHPLRNGPLRHHRPDGHDRAFAHVFTPGLREFTRSGCASRARLPALAGSTRLG